MKVYCVLLDAGNELNFFGVRRLAYAVEALGKSLSLAVVEARVA